MKKKVAILGSTSSIGKSLLDIINKDQKKFKIELLTANTNYKELIDLRIRYQNGYFKFLIPRDRLTSSSARIFGLWITVPALIMVIISLIF